MSRFRFKLEKVLELRREAETQMASRLAEAHSEAAAARRIAAALENALATGRERLAIAHDAGISVGELQSLRSILDELTRMADDADEASRAAEARVNAMLLDFARATRERRIIDRLRDRELEDWRADQARAEQKKMDELASVRHHRADTSTLAAEGDGK